MKDEDGAGVDPAYLVSDPSKRRKSDRSHAKSVSAHILCVEQQRLESAKKERVVKIFRPLTQEEQLAQIK